MYKSALKIVQTLQDAGYTAYFAGGCVRDMLLDLHPKDYDVATNAKPEEVEKLIEKTEPIGKSFGVILAKRGSHSVEIATFRKESDHYDGRRPSTIYFTDAKEDAIRRDFTINGMFFDPVEQKLIDYVDGQKDLSQGYIRFIGDPEERIVEDHLRIIRAIRFKHTFDFAYDPETFAALKKNVKLVNKLSIQRVREELIKIFSLPNTADVLRDMESLGLLEIYIPELLETRGVEQGKHAHAEGDVWHHIMRCLESMPKHTDYLTRLGVIFHDIAKPQTRSRDEHGNLNFHGHEHLGGEMAVKILKRLGFSKQDQQTVSWLVKHHLMDNALFQMTETRRQHWFRMENFGRLLEVMKADAKGCSPTHLKDWTKLHKMYEEWKRQEKELKKLEDLMPVDGKDIMEHFKLEPGQEVGRLLNLVREAYLDEHIFSKEEAFSFLEKNK